jgi:hypothetical protein
MIEEKGRGESNRLAEALRISPALVSSILGGDRDFSAEQILDIAINYNLTKVETDYLMCLVSIERAGTEDLKKFWRTKKNSVIKDAEKINQRIKVQSSIGPEEQAIYYSHVVYSQIRLLSTLEKGITKFQIEKTLNINPEQAQEAIDYLSQIGLIVEKSSHYFSAKKNLHINKDSPHYARHHVNWRLSQIQKSVFKNSDNLVFTYPCTLDEATFQKIKNLILDTITAVSESIAETNPEQMACLTIDFIKY